MLTIEKIQINPNKKLFPDMSRQEVERVIVDASRIGQLRVRIDHSKVKIEF